MRSFLEFYDLKEETKRAYLALGVLNPLASSAILTGGLTSIITAGYLRDVSWLQWFIWMAVPYYIFLLCGLSYLLLMYKARATVQQVTALEKEQLTEKPEFVKEDYWIIGIITCTVLLWVTDGIHGLDPAVPLLVAFGFLTVFTKAVNWKALLATSLGKNILIIGSMLSLINVLEQYEILASLTFKFTQLVSQEHSLLLVVGSILLFLGLLNMLIPNITVSITLLVPIAMSLADTYQLNEYALVLLVPMIVDGIKFYPAQSTPLVMVYNNSGLTTFDIFKLGLFMTVAYLLLVLVVVLPYWSLLGLTLS